MKETPMHRLFCSILILSVASCYHHSTTEPIVIGHLAPFSGPQKLIGKHARQGIQLAVEEVNNEGHLIAERTVEVRHVDTGSNGEVLQAEAIRLIKVNYVVALLGGTNPVEVEQAGQDHARL